MDDREIQSFAEVWSDANRSRALILVRYFSAAAAALVRRWKRTGASVTDKVTPGSLPARREIAIAEKCRALSRQMTEGFTKAGR